jgi:putative membrane protein
MEKEVRKVEMSENVADPTGLGLLGLAVVCFVVSTSRVGWSGPTTSVIIPWASTVLVLYLLTKYSVKLYFL